MKVHNILKISLLANVLLASFSSAQTPIYYNRPQNSGGSALFRMTQGSDVRINTGLNEADQCLEFKSYSGDISFKLKLDHDLPVRF